MHARLVAHVHRRGQVGQPLANDLLCRSLRFLRQIAVVEVDEIVVVDTSTRRATGQLVPYGLIDAAGDEPPLRKIQLPPGVEQLPQTDIRPDDVFQLTTQVMWLRRHRTDYSRTRRSAWLRICRVASRTSRRRYADRNAESRLLDQPRTRGPVSPTPGAGAYLPRNVSNHH